MKRDLQHRLSEAKENLNDISDDYYTDYESSPTKTKERKREEDGHERRPSEQLNMFNKFDNPLKFWKH